MEPWSFPVSTKFGATMIAINLAFDQWHHLGLENPPFQIRLVCCDPYKLMMLVKVHPSLPSSNALQHVTQETTKPRVLLEQSNTKRSNLHPLDA